MAFYARSEEARKSYFAHKLALVSSNTISCCSSLLFSFVLFLGNTPSHFKVWRCWSLLLVSKVRLLSIILGCTGFGRCTFQRITNSKRNRYSLYLSWWHWKRLCLRLGLIVPSRRNTIPWDRNTAAIEPEGETCDTIMCG